MTRARPALLAVLAAALVLGGCTAPSPQRADLRAFLDATFEPAGAGVWRSAQAVEPTADLVAGRMAPRDRFTEQGSAFLRARDYAVAVLPEGSGSRVELDDHDRVRTRYLPLIVGYWGRSPTSYGPRGPTASRPSSGGGFRGGGPGTGK